jgi:hypothetical protein
MSVSNTGNINNNASIVVTSSKTIVREGETVTFFVTGANIYPNTNVSYSLLGISPADLVNPSQISGNITLVEAEDNLVRGNIELGIIEDFRTEGPETIILSIRTGFPATLVIQNSVTVLDVSVTPPIPFRITLDKTQVIEGEDLEITIEDLIGDKEGQPVRWRILPADSDITIGDFDGLSELGDISSPIVEGNTKVILKVRDDFIIENDEFFIINLVDFPSISSQTIRIIDSGNTLIDSEEEYSGNVTIKFLDKASLSPVIGGNFIRRGKWEDSKGKLSEFSFLQGRLRDSPESSHVYYQPFSYVIRSGKSIEQWETSIKKLLHPAGLVVFSEINNDIDRVENSEITASLGTKVTDFFAITADNRRDPFRAGNLSYSTSRFDVLLTTDFAFKINDILYKDD